MTIFKSTPSRRGRRTPTIPPDWHSGDLNPLPHAEGDVFPPSVSPHKSTFKSTPSRRGRPPCVSVCPSSIAFKSTPSRRGRQRMSVSLLPNVTFKSTPSRRVRLFWLQNRLQKNIFKSTPSRRGRRLTRCCPSVAEQTFKSTPSRRGRPPVSVYAPATLHLNPLPHAEGDSHPGT